MIRKLTVILYVVVAAAAGPLSAQEYAAVQKEHVLSVFQAANRKLTDAKTIKLNIDHEIFEEGSREAVSSSSGYFWRLDSFYFKSFSYGILTVQNKNYKVVLDTAGRVISVDHSRPLTPDADIARMSDLFKKYQIGACEMKTAKSGKKAYLVHFLKKEYPYGKIELETDAAGFISRITLWHQAQPGGKKYISVITYSGIDTGPRLDKKDFDTGDIVQIKNNEARASFRFRDYQLITHLNLN
jgi:hypothetical protein